jgi:hypothetical protein
LGRKPEIITHTNINDIYTTDMCMLRAEIALLICRSPAATAYRITMSRVVVAEIADVVLVAHTPTVCVVFGV